MIEHDDRSVTVNPNTHQDLFSIMQHHHNEITKAFPEDSFPYLFWMSQYKAATKDDSPTGMRWNPAMIRWCVYLQQKSSTAYAYDCLNVTNYTCYTKGSISVTIQME